jgi:hypothetical protein
MREEELVNSHDGFIAVYNANSIPFAADPSPSSIATFREPRYFWSG